MIEGPSKDLRDIAFDSIKNILKEKQDLSPEEQKEFLKELKRQIDQEIIALLSTGNKE